MTRTHKPNIKNIAVCFGGECRSYNKCSSSIRRFFESPNINVKYFAHAWNTNSYKVRREEGVKMVHEEHPIDHIDKDIRNYFPFEKIKVEEKFVQAGSWDNLFYSDAVANLFKREYEFKHNMTFDAVIKCRFDLAFNPKMTFMDIIQHWHIHQKTLYTDIWLMPVEWSLPNIDDCFYFGSSLTMDLVTANMPYLANRIYKEVRPELDPSQNPYYFSGPGINMYRWVKHSNIMTQKVSRPFTIYRRQVFDLDPITQYSEIVNQTRNLF